MNQLHELIRRLTPGMEFLIVITWAFGMPTFSSILSIGDLGVDSGQPYFSNAGLVSILVFEMVQSLFLVWFLRIRGWTLEKLGLQVTLRGTGVGVILLAVTYLVMIAVQLIAQFALPIDMKVAIDAYPTAAANLNKSLVVTVSVVNGVFEEVFVAGYIISVLLPARGTWTAINVSTGIRLLYHLYQGPIGVMSIVPIGLIFGYAFARTRQLWPLIVAHILMDFIGLTMGTSGNSP